MSKIVRSLLAAVLCFSAGLAHSDVSVGEYKKFKGTPQMNAYLGGVGNAYSWSNVVLRSRGERPLFCQPEKLALGLENYRDFLDREINEKHVSDSDYIELLLLLHLRKVFSCTK